ANSKQQTANSKQQTANSKQQTANSKQRRICRRFTRNAGARSPLLRGALPRAPDTAPLPQ
ncbi:hypothetical protein EHJ03_08240, partial [Cronobacter dublinensis]|nr:hypothetical protein [Cronobacter dublinensis]